MEIRNKVAWLFQNSDEQLFMPGGLLSAGEKKRAAIAGVLVMNSEILEPTMFLDPSGQPKNGSWRTC